MDPGIDERLGSAIQENVAAALAEDIGSGDLTAGLVPSGSQVCATIFTRENAVMSGRPWVDEVYQQIGNSILIDWQHQIPTTPVIYSSPTSVTAAGVNLS